MIDASFTKSTAEIVSVKSFDTAVNTVLWAINNLRDTMHSHDSLDEEYLQWQLGMYELAYGSFAKHYCLWLPKGNLGQLIEIEPKTKAEILGKLEELGYV